MNADFESLIRELFKPQLEELGITQPGSKFTFEDLFGLLESPTNPQVGAHCCALEIKQHASPVEPVEMLILALAPCQ